MSRAPINDDVRSIISALPRNLREETGEYARWLSDHARAYVQDLAEDFQILPDPETFVTVAVCKRIYDLPSEQLRTIDAIVARVSSAGGVSLVAGRETLGEDSRPVRELRSLKRDLHDTLVEMGFSYVMDSTTPLNLLRRMAKDLNGPKRSRQGNR